jgi:hypothetical protein
VQIFGGGDVTAGKAALMAGYAEAGAAGYVSRLIRRCDVQEALRERALDVAAAAGLSPEWVMRNLKVNVEQCMQSADKWEPAGANKGLELIGKRLRMWDDKASEQQGGAVIHIHLAAGPSGPTDIPIIARDPHNLPGSADTQNLPKLSRGSTEGIPSAGYKDPEKVWPGDGNGNGTDSI